MIAGIDPIYIILAVFLAVAVLLLVFCFIMLRIMQHQKKTVALLAETLKHQKTTVVYLEGILHETEGSTGALRAISGDVALLDGSYTGTTISKNS